MVQAGSICLVVIVSRFFAKLPRLQRRCLSCCSPCHVGYAVVSAFLIAGQRTATFADLLHASTLLHNLRTDREVVLSPHPSTGRSRSRGRGRSGGIKGFTDLQDSHNAREEEGQGREDGGEAGSSIGDGHGYGALLHGWQTQKLPVLWRWGGGGMRAREVGGSGHSPMGILIGKRGMAGVTKEASKHKGGQGERKDRVRSAGLGSREGVRLGSSAGGRSGRRGVNRRPEERGSIGAAITSPVTVASAVSGASEGRGQESAGWSAAAGMLLAVLLMAGLATAVAKLRADAAALGATAVLGRRGWMWGREAWRDGGSESEMTLL